MKNKRLLPLLLVLSAAWFSQIVSAQTIVFDDSDGPFSILAQMVTVTSPNGGENWNGGETHDITWSLDSSITTVTIDYSLNGSNTGSRWPANMVNSGKIARTAPTLKSFGVEREDRTPDLEPLAGAAAAGAAAAERT
jgi:hypothetical protein